MADVQSDQPDRDARGPHKDQGAAAPEGAGRPVPGVLAAFGRSARFLRLGVRPICPPALRPGGKSDQPDFHGAASRNSWLKEGSYRQERP
jgi:hypothetical protein